MNDKDCILVPIDFSEDSRLALEAADRQAERCDSRLIVLHVKKPAENPRARLTFQEDVLERWARRRLAHTPQDRVMMLTLRGDPVEIILQTAAQCHPRKIIMGRGGIATRADSVAVAVGRRFSGVVEAVSAKPVDVFMHTAAG